jgi:hypothetical protein
VEDLRHLEETYIFKHLLIFLVFLIIISLFYHLLIIIQTSSTALAGSGAIVDIASWSAQYSAIWRRRWRVNTFIVVVSCCLVCLFVLKFSIFFCFCRPPPFGGVAAAAAVSKNHNAIHSLDIITTKQHFF